MGQEEKSRQKAVALSYDAEKDRAPKVRAKGRGVVARKIIETAKAGGVPVTEDPDLVESLMRLETYEEVPPLLYRAVAELLAFAYRLNNKVGEERRSGSPGPP